MEFVTRILLMQLAFLSYVHTQVPIVINTWGFSNSTEKAWEFIKHGHSGIEAIEAGCSVCERMQCEGTVGYGGSPDENGETTLDALIFDGASMNMGAVGALRRIKNVISVARHVLEHTTHSLLVGELATQFAVEMGFKAETLTTHKSHKIWTNWRLNSCQKNSWMNVVPDSEQHCGPYKPISENHINYNNNKNLRDDFGSKNHDTIGMVIIDNDKNIIAGTSTNGMTHKIPGRVGDSPIPGAGAYADNEAGGAAATGDGDVMMRFLPSFLAVEEMRRGVNPTDAAKFAINRIVKKYKHFFGGVIAVNIKGEYGAACNGMDKFPFSVVNDDLEKVEVQFVTCDN